MKNLVSSNFLVAHFLQLLSTGDLITVMGQIGIINVNIIVLHVIGWRKTGALALDSTMLQGFWMIDNVIDSETAMQAQLLLERWKREEVFWNRGGNGFNPVWSISFGYVVDSC